ncbi:unnamed protein product [Owenia fusiformis]|uniref:Uncharacterized protein n=1 Tax=Owenia fusiformis TaxID=6347 RepID=A0A8J1TSU2_OWEFU|nr:unnamed protein product [Owenia fusiformis]
MATSCQLTFLGKNWHAIYLQSTFNVIVSKQLKTNVTLEEHLARKKTFSQPAVYKPGTKELTGSVSLAEYKDRERLDGIEQELRQYGLTEDEIYIKLQAETDSESNNQVDPKKKRLGIDPSIQKAQLKITEDKIQARKQEISKPTRFHGIKVLTRQEMDFENSITHDDKTKALNMLITRGESQNDTTHPDDPINHLDTLLDDVSVKTKHQKRKKYTKKEVSKIEAPSSSYPACEWQTTWEHPNLNDWKNAPTCAERPGSKQGERSRSPSDIESIPEDIIRKFRLSADEIRNIDRFKDYSPGDPSNVLYVKNLSAKVTHEDLVSLFIRYQQEGQPKIGFKLMSGRMKGQAFVTFHDTKTASEAMDLIHGYQFRGKPVIIQYGKNCGSK